MATKPPPPSERLPIPQPPMKLFGIAGNLPDLDPSFLAKSIWRLNDLYGPIYQLDFIGRKIVVVSSQEYTNELCDESRFRKKIGGALQEVRAVAGDALFTADLEEPNWGIAHRVLVPVFGPLRVRQMFSEMLDVVSQLILKWDRLGPKNNIICSDDFTICPPNALLRLCAFDYRFNNFYSKDIHPFANQMAEVLVECGMKARRTFIENSLRVFTAAKFQKNITAMHKLCDEIIRDRENNPRPEANDLLSTMLNVADPETGKKLSSENIRYQMVTFLIAGHETTSGTLSFLFYHFMKNPIVLQKAQQEVDTVIGSDALQPSHLAKLKYIDACIKETLRFLGPINLLSVTPLSDTTIGGKYEVDTSTPCILNLRGLHHDPEVWGEDHNIFRPERMLEGGFAAKPPNSWKPFGNGVRSCIGRAFAEQEMVMTIALILQRFQVEAVDPSYELKLMNTLTIKPDDFEIRVRRRPDRSATVGLSGGAATNGVHHQSKGSGKITPPESDVKNKILVAYGSNAGTCKAFAEEIQTKAMEMGFDVAVETLDHVTEHIPIDRPLIIITPSYEGKPADNAKKFSAWLESNISDSSKLQGVNYTVFGVGNSEWASTFHRIPRLVDDTLARMGAHRFLPLGLVDVKVDPIGPFEDWSEELWTHLREHVTHGQSTLATPAELKATLQKSEISKTLGGPEIASGRVIESKQLSDNKFGSAKRHLEVELPAGVTYQTGDYLVVLPQNDTETVKRVLRRFKLNGPDLIQVSGTMKAFLQFKEPTAVAEALTTRVELSNTATQRQIEALANATSDESEKKALTRLHEDGEVYRSEILPKRFSLLDLLEDYPSCALSFSAYLDMLKPLMPRQYSIASSSLESSVSDETKVKAAVCYDVHEAPAWSGNGRTFKGVATNYMATRDIDNELDCFVRSTNRLFHLPTNTETPIIMVSAGTGIAPMRGFIMERAAIARAGSRKLGPALLYFGCRDYESDYIYKDELAEWEAAGAVSVRPAFSRRGPTPNGPKWAPDRLWDERKEVAELFRNGAKIFVCGSASKLAKSTAETCKRIFLEENEGKTEDDADRWLEIQKEDRYVTDVFE
ncbi:MAG: hypothetical protein M1828_002542 [Chrysothrix sp. TS-e1954]|nr:MAG: hypothetical protein M1828_002542 [Chrysothrix sp. TS-e1954]